MADPLYLSLWFPSFEPPEMMPHIAAVMRQFPFSAQRPGVTYLELHPVSWGEPTILERRFSPAVDPGLAAEVAEDLLHEDYAYVFTAYWDLWSRDRTTGPWVLLPCPVKFIAQGTEFEDGDFQETGHIQVEFGLDAPFLQEELRLTADAEVRVRANVQQLVDFTTQVEKNSEATGRLLWSESEENLSQKLIARLQRVQ
jgi:hypothetical protein